MRAITLAIVAALVLACGQGSATSTSTSPSPSPSPRSASPSAAVSPSPAGTTPTPPPPVASFGVLATVGQSYTLSIVGADGHVAASTTAASRSGLSCVGAGPILPFPTVSISDSRVYYLDGNTAVKYLTPGGAGGMATSVPGDGSLGSTFAVSPDDKRIAVVATDYGKNPVSYRIYVEDLGNHGNHVEIFSATGNTVPWAMGWHAGQLVLGITGSCTQGGGPFSASPWEYHLVDPNTAVRSATLGSPSTCPVRALPTPAGALCQAPTSTAVIGWDGRVQRTLALGAGDQYFAFALSPSGLKGAACCGADASPVYAAFGAAGGKVPGGGDSLGFIDDDHLLIGGVAVQSQSRVYALKSGVSTPVSALGFFVGRLPGEL